MISTTHMTFNINMLCTTNKENNIILTSSLIINEVLSYYSKGGYDKYACVEYWEIQIFLHVIQMSLNI